MLTLANFGVGKQLSAEAQGLYMSIGALALALAPHVTQLPIFVPVLIVTIAAWRVVIEANAWRLPPKWLRVVGSLAAVLFVAATFRTLNGLEAGTALLATMAGMKMLESRGLRDCTVLIFIGFVLLFAALLYNQSLLRLPYIIVCAWVLAATLLRLHRQRNPPRPRVALRAAGAMLLQAMPVALLLFLFFPRLPGQFWALPARSSAATGLNDEMAPGDISELSISGEIAFRVKFAAALPPPAERYWRGPVLHDFDGRRWRRERGRAVLGQSIVPAGTEYRYRITMEPTQRQWLLALDVPTSWPDGNIRLYDFQLLTRQSISTISSFDLVSHTRFTTPKGLPQTLRSIDTRLPDEGNPRTRALATQLRAGVDSDGEFIATILERFRREEFYYTLTPPLLGDNSVDDFLFNTRSGFCEHFASAFTVLMRAANIPARVVTGYQGGEFNSMGEYLLVRQSDAHAWSEVWLEDRGWVRVDPTAAVAPERIERNLDAAIPASESVPGRFMRTNTFFSRARLTWDAVNNFWNERIVQYNEMTQRSLMQWLGVRDADWRDLGVAFALTLVAFFVALSAYLAWRFRPRARDPVGIVYAQLCKKLARAGIERADYEGPVDYLRRVAATRPEWASDLVAMRSLYANLRYGPNPLPTELSRLKYLVDRLRVT